MHAVNIVPIGVGDVLGQNVRNWAHLGSRTHQLHAAVASQVLVVQSRGLVSDIIIRNASKWYVCLVSFGQRRRVVAVQSLSIGVFVNATHVATSTPSSPKSAERLIQRHRQLVGWRQGVGHVVAGGLRCVKEQWLLCLIVDFKWSRDFKNRTGTGLGSTHLLHSFRLCFKNYHKGLSFIESITIKLLVRTNETYPDFVYINVSPGPISSMFPEDQVVSRKHRRSRL